MNDKRENREQARPPLRRNSPPVATVFDEAYCVDAAPLTSTTKQCAVFNAASELGLVAHREVAFEVESAWAAIHDVHDSQYVCAVRTGAPRRLAESQGFRWSSEFADSAARIWSGHLAACSMALEERMVMHPVSGAHHARRAAGAGFCTFNFLVGAARHLLHHVGVERVAIIDLDAHQGDGTHALTEGCQGIGTFDIASADWGCRSRGRHEAYAVVGDADGYREALARLPAFLDQFKPSFAQYQAGVDCHETDPLGAVEGLTSELLSRRDCTVLRALAVRGIPTVVNIAGGYQPDGTTHRLHLQTFRAAGEALAAWLPRARASGGSV